MLYFMKRRRSILSEIERFLWGVKISCDWLNNLALMPTTLYYVGNIRFLHSDVRSKFQCFLVDRINICLFPLQYRFPMKYAETAVVTRTNRKSYRNRSTFGGCSNMEITSVGAKRLVSRHVWSTSLIRSFEKNSFSLYFNTFSTFPHFNMNWTQTNWIKIYISSRFHYRFSSILIPS